MHFSITSSNTQKVPNDGTPNPSIKDQVISKISQNCNMQAYVYLLLAWDIHFNAFTMILLLIPYVQATVEQFYLDQALKNYCSAPSITY